MCDIRSSIISDFFSEISEIWPCPYSNFAFALGMCLINHSACLNGTIRSRSPCQIVTGIDMFLFWTK